MNGVKTYPNRNQVRATANCSLKSDGSLDSINLISGGSGYTNAPDVSFYGGGIDSASAIMADKSVSVIRVTNCGAGYTNPPSVTFSPAPAGGVTATGTCSILDGKVNKIIMTNRGKGYSSPPTMTFGSPPPGGVQATGTTTVDSKFITEIMITNGGYEHSEFIPSIIISGGGCSVDASWYVDSYYLSQTISSKTLVNGLYKIGELREQLSSSEFTQTPLGGYYASSPTVSFLYQNGYGPRAVAKVSGGSVVRIRVLEGGKFFSPPNLVLTNGGGFTPGQLVSSGVGRIIQDPEFNEEGEGYYYLLGVPQRDAVADSMMEDLMESGVVVIGAAGNSNSRCSVSSDAGYDDEVEILSYTHYKDNPNIPEYPSPDASSLESLNFARGMSPSAADGVVCVGSLSNECCPEYKSNFSNSGTRLNLYAPGSFIISSWHSANDSVPHPNNSSKRMKKISGTSMASPQVAGAVACYAQNRNDVNQNNVKAWIESNSRPTVSDGSWPKSLNGGLGKMLYYPGLQVDVG
jgi:hypothetical protein